MTTFHGDLGRQPRGSAMDYHDRALKEVDRAFAGRAEQEVVATARAGDPQLRLGA
jgi:hypothetical protein